jgi:hypothetical protein
MNLIVLIGALIAAAPPVAQAGKAPITNAPPTPRAPSQTSSNPWDSLPAMTPYRKLAEEIRAEGKAGQASPLDPGCQGKTGDECVRSMEPPKR